MIVKASQPSLWSHMSVSPPSGHRGSARVNISYQMAPWVVYIHVTACSWGFSFIFSSCINNALLFKGQVSEPKCFNQATVLECGNRSYVYTC